MKLLKDVHYKKHVLVCCNERIDRECCANVSGKEIFAELKRWVIEQHLSSDIWVTRTGCLGFCNKIGTTVVIYPDKKWFLETRMGEIDKIKQELICQ